jgi:hypothetical protein
MHATNGSISRNVQNDVWHSITSLSHVCTNFGDSDTSYAWLEIPFQGVYQGNGAGPGIWMLVSIPIINMLKAQGFGFKIINAMSKETFSFVCYAFVDDTDLVHSSPDLEVREMMSEMQVVIDTWEGGLRASGGALVPSKSYWYLIHTSSFTTTSGAMLASMIPREACQSVMDQESTK